MKIETVQDRREYLVAAIADIGEQMKGPMPNFERMMLHEERKDLRAELAKMGEIPAARSANARGKGEK